MAITNIPTEKVVPGRTVAVEFLASTVADGQDFFKGQRGVISCEAFFLLRAQGYARLAAQKPVDEPMARSSDGPIPEQGKAKSQGK